MAVVNLGQISAIHIGTIPPSNTKMMWYDDNTGQKIIKYYDIGSSTWKTFSGTGTFVEIAGSVMTGYLTLSGAPTNPLHAATKKYVDDTISNSSNTLQGILTGGNTTGGKNIVVSSGDVLQYSNGAGGSLNSAVTTANRTWTLPDSSGTILIGTGTDDYIPRWKSGGLQDSTIKDNGVTAGIGLLDPTVALNITTTLEKGLVSISTSTSGGIGIVGKASSIAAGGRNIGGSFEGQKSDTENVGVEGTGVGSSVANGYGGIFSSLDSELLGLGVIGNFSGVTGKAVGVLGRNLTALGSPDSSIGILGGLTDGAEFGLSTIPDIQSAVVGYYTGTQEKAGVKHAGYFKNSVVNTGQANIGLFVSAENGDNNYGIIVESGSVGIGESNPTRQLVVSNGFGKYRVDTTEVTIPNVFDTKLTDTSILHNTAVGIRHSYSVDSKRVFSILPTGQVVVGNGDLADSHLDIKYLDGTPEMNGKIKSTVLNNTPYNYSSPLTNRQLVLKNESQSNDGYSSIDFTSDDSSGDEHVGSYIGTVYPVREVDNITGSLVFGTSDKGTLKERLRVHSSGEISIGTETKNTKLLVVTSTDKQDGIVARQDSINPNASSFLRVESKNSDATYTGVVVSSTGDSASSSGVVSGEQKYLENSGHVYTEGSGGHLNLFSRTGSSTLSNDVRIFTGGQNYDDNLLRVIVKGDGRVGFNLSESQNIVSVISPLSKFHVATGSLFESDGDKAEDHLVVLNGVSDRGGLVVTQDPTFTSNSGSARGFKLVSKTDGTIDEDILKIGRVGGSTTQTWIDKHALLGKLGITIGSHIEPNEALTVDGSISLVSGESPTDTTGFGKVYIKGDDNLYYLDQTGVEYKLNRAGTDLTGSGVSGEVTYFTSQDNISSDNGFTWDGNFLGIRNLKITDIQNGLPTSILGLKSDGEVVRTSISIPTKTSDLVNDSDFISKLYADGRYIRTTQKGTVLGVAELDSSGKVPVSQLPSYVSNVQEYDTLIDFPPVGEDSVIYLALDTNRIYRWSGSQYIEIGDGDLSLGETSTTAYRGDRGKIAYDHSLLTTGNPHNVNKSDVGLGNVDNTSDANKPISIPAQNEFNNKQDVSSKVTDLNTPNNTDYPTTKAVTDYIKDGILTIKNNGVTVGTFSANQSTNKSIDILTPTKTSDLVNDSNFLNTTNIDGKTIILTAGNLTASALNIENTTGLSISFDKNYVYHTKGSPGTGNITEDLTDAIPGCSAKIYHNSSTLPTFPVGWVRLGSGFYKLNELNIIYAEYSGDRVEYWVVQEN